MHNTVFYDSEFRPRTETPLIIPLTPRHNLTNTVLVVIAEFWITATASSQKTSLSDTLQAKIPFSETRWMAILLKSA